jgi:hypothetical protein
MPDFDSAGMADIVVADIFGLRTFRVIDGKLTSVVVNDDSNKDDSNKEPNNGFWEDGTCTAICVANRDDPDHVAPADGCRCGIYGTYGIDHLVHQYGEQAARIVAVIQAAGSTVTGSTGFKTSQAVVVGYWVSDSATAEEAACVAHLPGVRRWWNRSLMIEMFELRGRKK